MQSRPGFQALGAVLLLACSAESLGERSPSPALETALPSSVAPAGKVRLFVGQDVDSIEAYARDVALPSAVVSYTSLVALEGLSEPRDNGGGLMHLGRLVEQFPGAPVALGLYLVGQLPEINAGALDSNIDTLARALASYGVPVLLRVGYEFDGEWNHYDPVEYTLAFRRVAERIDGAGATNVELVWQAAASCGETFGGHPVEAWYPGSDVVDWMAASFFAQQACQFSPLKRMLHLAREQQKPFFIAESAPQGYDLSDETYSPTGADRQPRPATLIVDEWYAPYFELIASSLDVVRAVAYINADWDTQPQWAPPYRNGYFGDSRVQANAVVLEHWRAALASGHFWP
jgi:hypothetical protein